MARPDLLVLGGASGVAVAWPLIEELERAGRFVDDDQAWRLRTSCGLPRCWTPHLRTICSPAPTRRWSQSSGTLVPTRATAIKT
jgi:hypothetical protein